MEMTSIEFKSKCLELMDHVKECHEEVIITQDSCPIVKLVPYEEQVEETVNLFGYMKGSVTINDEILKPIDEKWHADIQKCVDEDD
jgi:prevent-host-death family protein